MCANRKILKVMGVSILFLILLSIAGVALAAPSSYFQEASDRETVQKYLQEGTNVKLVDDITWEAFDTNISKEVTLDLNGHHIENASSFIIKDGGHLIIKDSQFNKDDAEKTIETVEALDGKAMGDFITDASASAQDGIAILEWAETTSSSDDEIHMKDTTARKRVETEGYIKANTDYGFITVDGGGHFTLDSGAMLSTRIESYRDSNKA